MEESRRRTQALADCNLPSHSVKAEYVKIGIAPIFRYSAGLVPWSDAELSQLSSLWASGVKAGWGFPSSMDTAAVRVSSKLAGKHSPSALSIWMQDVEGLLSQCSIQPGLIQDLVAREVQSTCRAHGCRNLQQLQRMLRLPCNAPRSVVKTVLPPLLQHCTGPLLYFLQR